MTLFHQADLGLHSDHLAATPLNILILANRTTLPNQLLSSLNRSGFVPDWECIESEAEFLAELRAGWDLILMFHPLPGFEAEHALQLMLDRRPDIPFILLVEGADLNAAVAYMKQGAADVIPMNQLSRLGEATKQAMDEREARQSRHATEMELNESENRYRRLVELSPAAIVVQSRGAIVYANPAAVKLAGAKRAAQLLGKSALDFVPPAMHEETLESLLRVEKNGETVPIVEEQLLTLDGRIIDVELSVNPVTYLNQTALQVAILDTSARKRTERALEESEKRYRQIVETASDVAYITDIGGNFGYISAAIRSMTGYEPADLLGKHCTEIIRPDWRLRAVAFYRTQLRERSPETAYELPILTLDGDEIWVEQTTTLITDGDRVTGFQSIARDITRRKEAENLMEESEERYRTLFEATFEAIAIYDQSKIVEVNRSFEQMFQCTREDAIGRSVLDFCPEEARPLILAKIEQAVEEPYEATGLRMDGTTFQGELHAKEINYRGHPMRVVAMRDISEHKRAQDAERDQRKFAEALAQTAAVLNRTLELDEVLDHILLNIENVLPHQVADIMLLEEAVIRIVRSHGYQKFGVTEEALAAVRLTLDDTPNMRLMAESRRALIITDVEQSADWVKFPASDWIRSYVGAPICLSGEVIGFLNVNADTAGFFTPDHAGRLQAFADQAAVAIQNARLFDMSRSYAEELEARVADRTRELQAANEHLQELSRVKDQFVSNVSHELRTPITNIKLYHGLLTLNPARQEAYIATLERETERLENIVEDLLYLSRLDQGAMKLQLVPEDVSHVAENYVTDRLSLAESKGLELGFEGGTGLPPVPIDRMQLGKALSILLTNALNYTPSGGRVTVSTAAENLEGKPWVTLSVRDTGPGIPPEEHDGVFKRFNRGSVGLDSGAPGTGLGLAIANEIVERHQGHINFASTGTLDAGTIFTIWLPANSD